MELYGAILRLPVLQREYTDYSLSFSVTCNSFSGIHIARSILSCRSTTQSLSLGLYEA